MAQASWQCKFLTYHRLQAFADKEHVAQPRSPVFPIELSHTYLSGAVPSTPPHDEGDKKPALPPQSSPAGAGRGTSLSTAGCCTTRFHPPSSAPQASWQERTGSPSSDNPYAPPPHSGRRPSAWSPWRVASAPSATPLGGLQPGPLTTPRACQQHPPPPAMVSLYKHRSGERSPTPGIPRHVCLPPCEVRRLPVTQLGMTDFSAGPRRDWSGTGARRQGRATPALPAEAPGPAPNQDEGLRGRHPCLGTGRTAAFSFFPAVENASYRAERQVRRTGPRVFRRRTRPSVRLARV